MRVAVCIKQVPDTEARLRIARDGRWLDEEDLPFVINESDEYALEEALRIAEATGGGEVVVFSLGPERVREALRKALARGRRARGPSQGSRLRRTATRWRPAARSPRPSPARASTWCSPARSRTTWATAAPARCSPGTSAGRTPGW